MVIGERNSSSRPQSWQGSSPTRKTSKSDRGRVTLARAGTKRLRGELPEPRPGKVLLPKDLPAGDGSPVGAEESGKLADSPRRRPLPHGRNQDHHGTEVNLPAEKPNRWRCHPLATTVPIATEAEPQAVWLGEIIATARLAGILGRVQPAAARARLLAGIVGEVLVDRKKKRPEAGVARQIMIQSRVLRYAGNIQEYTPREPRSSDQALRGDFQ